MGILSVGEIHRGILRGFIVTFAPGTCAVWDQVRVAMVATTPMREDHSRPHLLACLLRNTQLGGL